MRGESPSECFFHTDSAVFKPHDFLSKACFLWSSTPTSHFHCFFHWRYWTSNHGHSALKFISPNHAQKEPNTILSSYWSIFSLVSSYFFFQWCNWITELCLSKLFDALTNLCVRKCCGNIKCLRPTLIFMCLWISQLGFLRLLRGSL